MLAIPLTRVLGRAYNRRDYRFPVQLLARTADADNERLVVAVTDLSLQWSRLVSRTELKLEGRVPLSLALPGGSLLIEGDVAHKLVAADGSTEWGIRFVPLGAAERHRLTAFLFITATRRQLDGSRQTQGQAENHRPAEADASVLTPAR
jgi:hypothetical protein